MMTSGNHCDIPLILEKTKQPIVKKWHSKNFIIAFEREQEFLPISFFTEVDCSIDWLIRNKILIHKVQNFFMVIHFSFNDFVATHPYIDAFNFDITVAPQFNCN